MRAAAIGQGDLADLYEVDEASGCWLWKGAKSKGGYGYLRVMGTPTQAHRVFYERHKGAIPEGLHIDHLCRVRGCVNPDHLEPVTLAENGRRGLNAKLTPDGVREIRASRERAIDLAVQYGVSPQLISNVRKRRYWRDV